MKRFVFRFESLRRVETHRERLRQEEMAQAEREVAACQEELDQAQQQFMQARQEHSDILSTGGAVGMVQMALSYRNHLHQQIGLAQGRLDLAQEAKHQALQSLVEQTQKRKVMDKLKEKATQAYHKEALVEEQKALDEVAILRKGGKGG